VARDHRSNSLKGAIYDDPSRYLGRAGARAVWPLPGGSWAPAWPAAAMRRSLRFEGNPDSPDEDAGPSPARPDTADLPIHSGARLPGAPDDLAPPGPPAPLPEPHAPGSHYAQPLRTPRIGCEIPASNALARNSACHEPHAAPHGHSASRSPPGAPRPVRPNAHIRPVTHPATPAARRLSRIRSRCNTSQLDFLHGNRR
jgi:hypothetical protein